MLRLCRRPEADDRPFTLLNRTIADDVPCAEAALLKVLKP